MTTPQNKTPVWRKQTMLLMLNPTRMTLFIALIVLAFCPDARAMKEDTMKEGLTTIESFLTGNMMRLMVLGGAAYGAFHAFMKQQPALLMGSVGTGLGTNFLLDWVKSTWTMMI